MSFLAQASRRQLRGVKTWSVHRFELGPLRFARKLAVAVIMVLTCSPACAEPLVRVFAIRGLAGVVFSRGMNKLCDDLASIQQVTCTVEDFFNASSIEDKAAEAMSAGKLLVLVGHSLGAHVALRVAAAMNGSVPLIVSIDPNWFAPPAVPDNAKAVLNYYQDFNVLGRGVLKPSPDFQGEFQQNLRREAHVVIDGSPDIHAEITKRIRKILASADSPPPEQTPSSSNRRRR